MTQTMPALDARSGPSAEPLAPSSSTAPRTRPWHEQARRPALAALLIGTAMLYLWGLGSSGWANPFYSAAAQAGSESWKAFFFGSSDAGNAITVDKTPLALWPMALSVRLFGLSSWSILVPQALMGVGSVGLLYLTVKRATASTWAGLMAGLLLALTPVAVLMFRFNNPDAALVLLLIGSVYATLRAIDSPQRALRWIVVAGALVGLAFLAKMLQAFLVLPGLALAYAICANVSWPRRIGHLLAAFGSMLLSFGWWIAIVELWPSGSRPYIGGSQNDSILELTLGYNGLGRLNGDETGSVGGAPGGGWGETGIGRMVNSAVGGQIAWLLPAALVLLIAGLWCAHRSGRSDRRVAALVAWGGWLVVTLLTFSFMAGIFHEYYTVALAPAVAALVAIGGLVLWQHRTRPAAAMTAAFTLAMTGAVAFTLLGRTSDFVPWLRWIVIVTCTVAAVLLVVAALLPRRVATAVTVAAFLAVLAGPTAYSVATAATPHTGSIVTAGPNNGGAMPGAGGFGPAGGRTGTGAATDTGQQPPGGGGGGLLNGSESTEQIDALLEQDSEGYTWAAAAIGSNTAAGYQLSTELPVLAIGGFNGSDPSPTLEQFQRYVADGEIHYFIASGGGGMGPGGGTSTEISAWIEENFAAQTVDGVTIYDLSTGVR